MISEKLILQQLAAIEAGGIFQPIDRIQSHLAPILEAVEYDPRVSYYLGWIHALEARLAFPHHASQHNQSTTKADLL
ncbi:MAG: hypothetical protein H7842_09975 [Gammaproteobacteria bacterium SHHR-1]